MGQIATLLGKTDDAERYAALADEIRAVWLRKFRNEDGTYATNSQCSNAIALVLGLAEHEDRDEALAALVSASAGLTALLSGLQSTAARLVTAATLGSAVLFIHTPGLARLLHLGPLGLEEWVIVMAGSVFGLAPLAIDRTMGRIGGHRAAGAVT